MEGTHGRGAGGFSSEQFRGRRKLTDDEQVWIETPVPGIEHGVVDRVFYEDRDVLLAELELQHRFAHK